MQLFVYREKRIATNRTRHMKSERKVRKWLGEEGFSVEELGGGGTTFNFWVTKKGTPSFSIFQSKDKHDVVLY